ncbi:hypothetical protein [Streptomyces sp. NBC_00207]|uniref:hypothetical protein n=1 Tax=unclassified Streptomyces TaxID=2593676 RepID=UPI002887BF18|nr:hypothetical protein [Streptomyces sp. DSM 41633]
MSTVTDPQPQTPQQHPQPSQPATDLRALVTLCLFVVVLVLAMVGYVCVAHPSLTGPIATVATVAGVLVAAVGVAVAVRRR